jgi:nitrite reductase/ring-hydroxylating ferredoxin subunit
MTGTRTVVAPVRDFPSGTRRIVAVGGRSIGVFRFGDRFYALRNRCPHQGGPLCEGRVSPDVTSGAPGEFGIDADRLFLACPWHGWEYDLATGQSFLGPGETRVRSYDAAVVAGRELGEPQRPPAPGGREPGPYVAETFPVSVDEDYVILET